MILSTIEKNSLDLKVIIQPSTYSQVLNHRQMEWKESGKKKMCFHMFKSEGNLVTEMERLLIYGEGT